MTCTCLFVGGPADGKYHSTEDFPGRVYIAHDPVDAIYYGVVDVLNVPDKYVIDGYHPTKVANQVVYRHYSLTREIMLNRLVNGYSKKETL